MKEVAPIESGASPEAATFAACVATILELRAEELPLLSADEDPVTGGTIRRWLGALSLGLVPLLDVTSFSWAGPWIARIRPAAAESGRRAVVMYGVPSGVVWDPSGVTEADGWEIEDGFVLSALDIALARPPRVAAPVGTGMVEEIWTAAEAAVPADAHSTVGALAGLGLEGDRHVAGTGTFPSGVPGSALTLIEAEVCESFEPALGPDVHRRNIVTRGIQLNGLVGRDFTIGTTRCRGMRLCEPCVVVERYASQPVLRKLVHRGGLRADILADGVVSVGDSVQLADL